MRRLRVRTQAHQDSSLKMHAPIPFQERIRIYDLVTRSEIQVAVVGPLYNSLDDAFR